MGYGAEHMFTGIVQSMGTVRTIQRGATHTRLIVEAPRLLRPIPDGSSICVSGVCLTVTSSTPSDIAFDVVPETLSCSTLAALSVGSQVNLERSLRVGDGLDGHMVQGHVDATARVLDVRKDSSGYRLSIAMEESIRDAIIPKGSVAIDGVSLTIACVGSACFEVAIIPTTAAATTLGTLRAGEQVNIETDILARTVVHTLKKTLSSSPSPLSVEQLRENGW